MSLPGLTPKKKFTSTRLYTFSLCCFSFSTRKDDKFWMFLLKMAEAEKEQKEGTKKGRKERRVGWREGRKEITKKKKIWDSESHLKEK